MMMESYFLKPLLTVSDPKLVAVAQTVPPLEKQSFTDNELSVSSFANKIHMAHLKKKKNQHQTGPALRWG